MLLSRQADMNVNTNAMLCLQYPRKLITMKNDSANKRKKIDPTISDDEGAELRKLVNKLFSDRPT